MATSVPPTFEPPPYRPPFPRRSITPESLTAIFGVILGVTLFAGLFAYHSMFLIPVPCTSPSGCTASTPEVQAYDTTLRVLAWTAFGVIDASVAFSVTAAFVIGAARSTISDGVRRGMFLYASVFTLAWIVFSTFLISLIFGSFLRFI